MRLVFSSFFWVARYRMYLQARSQAPILLSSLSRSRGGQVGGDSRNEVDVTEAVSDVWYVT